MAAPQKKPSAPAVILIRPNNTIALPPGPLGFNSLIEPESFQDGELKFKLNYHLTSEGIEALIQDVEEKVYSKANMDKLQAEFDEKGVTNPPAPRPAKDWLEGILRAPKENATDFFRLPCITVGTKAEYKDHKTGSMVRREIACWDAKNKKLNLAKLRLGRGSIIQPVVYPNVFYAGAKTIQGTSIPATIMPSLRLVGVRVLKLERWGGAGSQAAEVTDAEIQNVMGADFVYDDLDAYAEGIVDDHDEATDLTPEDNAKSLFGG
jgi:hypothetical protein